MDATYCKVRVNHRCASQAVVIATGISATGHRVILGVMVGDSESKPFWTKFLRSFRTRGLDNVRLVISDSHIGLVAAIRTVVLDSAWQRCRSPTPIRRPRRQSPADSLSSSAPFTALFITWTVPNLRFSPSPLGLNRFHTFVGLGFLDVHVEMTVNSAQNVTSRITA